MATGDGEPAPTADGLSIAAQATGVVNPGQSNGFDATGVLEASGPQPFAATAAFDRNPQGGSGPTGAFAPTAGATGAYDPGDPGSQEAGQTGAYDPTAAESQGAGPSGSGSTTQAMTHAGPSKDAGPAGSQRRCGNYLLKQFFAKGGMGEVWLAEDPVIGRSVALKRMLGHRAAQQVRFRVEAQITGQLEHPGIVPVHELGTNAEGEPYYVMKFVQGRTLHKVVQEFHARKLTGGALEVERLRLLQMFLSLCQTLAYAHSRGVIHRDLKPDNVMLGPFGETILLDWGIAKVLGQDDPGQGEEAGPSARLRGSIPDTGTQDGVVLGTPSYMAPEAAAGLTEEVDERSDIYLLGATLYEMLSGRQPRSAKTMRELIKQAREAPPKSVRSIDPTVPRALDAICLKAMAHAKADRYRTAAELADDIQRFIAGEPVSVYREALPARAWRWIKRHRKALGRSTAAVLIGARRFRGDRGPRRRASPRRGRPRGRPPQGPEQARADLKAFRHLADEANFFAATTNPASEHAPYFDPQKGAALAHAALEVADPWGPDLEALPLPEERTAIRFQLHGLLILAASETLRTDAGRAAPRKSWRPSTGRHGWAAPRSAISVSGPRPTSGSGTRPRRPS